MAFVAFAITSTGRHTLEGTGIVTVPLIEALNRPVVVAMRVMSAISMSKCSTGNST